jgi:hypothetical protein
MTGRGAGYCAGNNVAGWQMSGGVGRGRGFRRNGQSRGFFRNQAQPVAAAADSMGLQEKMDALQSQLSSLQQQLADLSGQNEK